MASTQDKNYNDLRNDLGLGLVRGEDPPDLPEPGQPERVNLRPFLLGLIFGRSLVWWFAIPMLIVVAVATLAKIAVFLMSYLVCMAAPPRFGASGQAKAMVFMGLVNAFIVAVFRLLPLLGMNFLIIVPFFAPELPMGDANAERGVPLHIFWSSWPALEMTATIVFVCCLAAEPVLAAIYLHSVGLSLKEEPIREPAVGLINLGLGAGFVLICYYLLSMTGNSDVLIGHFTAHLFACGPPAGHVHRPLHHGPQAHP